MVVSLVDLQLVAVAAGLITYSIYKRWEHQRPWINIVLLLFLPTLTVSLCYGNTARHIYCLPLILFYVIYWSTIIAATVAYRLSPFHPLAKYPGPLLCKVTKLRLAYMTSKGTLHETVKEIHVRYGDVVRIGPNELSFCRSDAVNPILGARLLQRGPYYDTRRQPNGRCTPDGVRDFSESSARRRPWLKAMSGEALKDYEGALVSKVQELCENLRRRQGETVDLNVWLSYFGFDFMGIMAFGREFGMMRTGGDVNGLLHLIEKGAFMNAIISHIPWSIPFFLMVPGAGQNILTMQNMGSECAAWRIQQSAQTKDLFYYLSGEDKDVDRNHDNIVENGLSAVVAGSDTVATALAHLCYFLLKHPACCDKLRKEIDEYFPDGEEPFNASLHTEMPYLNACINEAMRLYAPVMSGLQRRVERGTGGTTIAGHFVPAGTQVSVHTHTLHRHPSEFSPLPDEYWPERWLAQDVYALPSGGGSVPRDQVRTNAAAFIPFSVGPQNCVGKSLALMEIRAVLCALVRGFEMRAAPGFRLESWEEGLRDAFVTNRGPLLVSLKAL